MSRLDVLVIGGGLFGSVIAAAIEERMKLSVLILDAEHPRRGSTPAACLMKPSWLGRTPPDDRSQALELLDELYGVRRLDFYTGPVRHAVHWVDPAKVLGSPRTIGEVQSIEQLPAGHFQAIYHDETYDGLREVVARTVVVAAGVWTASVLSRFLNRGLRLPTVEAQAGVACLWADYRIDRPFITPWAPYKQLVGFNRGDGAWVGDGSAIKAANWTRARQAVSVERERRALGFPPSPWVELYGERPYVKDLDGAPAYLKELHPGLWCATGGAKNGTMGAAWAANTLLRRLP